MSTPRPANRSYSTEALERWFASLPESWEKTFRKADLEEGRRIYTEGLVRSLELKPHAAEAVTRTETQTVRAVIELGEGRIEWRTSLPEEENGAPYAVAGMYEVEELLADEISPVDDSAPAAAPAAPVEPERKDAGARAALKLQVAFELGFRLVVGPRRPCLELFRSRRGAGRRAFRRAAADLIPFLHRGPPRRLRLWEGCRHLGYR